MCVALGGLTAFSATYAMCNKALGLFPANQHGVWFMLVEAHPLQSHQKMQKSESTSAPVTQEAGKAIKLSQRHCIQKFVRTLIQPLERNWMSASSFR